MFKIGLKLWSVNNNYLSEAKRLLSEGICDYIELYVCPDSFGQYAGIWQSLDAQFIIHAAHFEHGLCLSKKDHFECNQKLINEALRFADQLNAEKVIVHPGIDGAISETGRQLNLLYDQRLIIENKPYKTQTGYICNGYSPEDIQFLKNEAPVGFCFDVGHAVCAANAQNIEKISYVKKFLSLGPVMFHVSDGDWDGIYDRHEHLGKGNFKYNEVVKYLPEFGTITIEAVHDSQVLLSDFEEDVKHLRKCEAQEKLNLQFNKATQADMMDVYELANDPIVRAMSFNAQPIELETHVRWFFDKIVRNDSFFYIVKDQGQRFIAQVRFDKNEIDFSYTISISLVKNARGFGLGQKIIQESIKRLVLDVKGVASVVALIKQDNIASLQTFGKVGFVVDGYQKINGYDACKMKYILA